MNLNEQDDFISKNETLHIIAGVVGVLVLLISTIANYINSSIYLEAIQLISLISLIYSSREIGKEYKK